MKSILVPLLIIMLIVLVQVKSDKPTKNFEMASNQFALELWQKLSAENQAKPEPENLFFSPYSIATALSMVYVGTDGNTKTELGSALKLNNTQLEDPQELATEIQKSSELMFGQSGVKKAYNLSSANALAISDNFEILDSYKKLIVDKFLAEMFSVDFAKDSTDATKQINQWVSNKTHDKIDNFLEEPLPSNTVMALLNAIYFKGSWKSSFNPNNTFNGTFVGFNRKEYPNVMFMSEKSRFNISVNQDAKFTMVELPYESGVISLYAFLPFNNGSNQFAQLKNQLNTTTIEQTIQEKYSNKITLQFPKLNLESKFDLNPILKSMGVNDLFEGQANLGGISKQTNIKVSGVLHQAMLELNEKGSEAAAVTGVTIEATSIQQEIILHFNRPFVFVIRHNRNGQLLFVGEVNQF